MDSDEDSNKNMDHSPPEGPKKPKRQMKTPFELETLEKTYSTEKYPSEGTIAELSEKLGLTARQLRMWFCHRRLKDRRLKDKKEAAGMAAMKPHSAAGVGKRSLMDSPQDEMMRTEPVIEPMSRSRSGSGSGSGSGSSQYDNGEDVPMVPIRYYESPRTLTACKVIACVEARLAGSLREDGPILGVEFDVLPPGAFGAPIVIAEHRNRFRHSYDKKSYGSYDKKPIKPSSGGLHEPAESKIKSDAYGPGAPAYLYDSPVVGTAGKNMPLVQANGHLPREYGIEGQASSANILPQQGRQGYLPSPSPNDVLMSNNEEMQMERKRKSDEARIEREFQAHEKRIRKELEKQDLLRRKMEKQMRKEMEKQDPGRRKKEQRIMREQQRNEEMFQREEKREMEGRERFMRRELLRAERRKQKEEIRRERELAKQKAAMERAAARRIAKESLELIEDDRLELMELAASSKGLPSIASLDYDALQGLELLRKAVCKFPPQAMKLKKPFAIHPWVDSEENVENLPMPDEVGSSRPYEGSSHPSQPLSSDAVGGEKKKGRIPGLGSLAFMIDDTRSLVQPGSFASASSSRSESSPATEARITQLEAELTQMREIVQGLTQHIRGTSGRNQHITQPDGGCDNTEGDGGGHSGSDSGAP